MTEARKVLVSGASSGIGRATALRFAQEGWDVALNARRQELLIDLKEQLPRANHLVCAGDYSDVAVAERIATRIQDEWGRLDALVNCAGVAIPGAALETPLDEWRKPFDIMVNGAVNL